MKPVLPVQWVVGMPPVYSGMLSPESFTLLRAERSFPD